MRESPRQDDGGRVREDLDGADPSGPNRVVHAETVPDPVIEGDSREPCGSIEAVDSHLAQRAFARSRRTTPGASRWCINRYEVGPYLFEEVDELSGRGGVGDQGYLLGAQHHDVEVVGADIDADNYPARWSSRSSR